MPRALASLNQGGYVEPIDVTTADLDQLVALLRLTDPSEHGRVREQIYLRLEDFKTARARTAKAKPISDDLRDLETVATAMDPMRAIDQPDLALDALESLRSTNFVLYRRRLQWQLRPRRIHDLIRAPSSQSPSRSRASRGTVLAAIAALRAEIRAEDDGRGAPADCSRAFDSPSASSRSGLRVHGRGTSRQNALGRGRDPFGEFVDAGGQAHRAGLQRPLRGPADPRRPAERSRSAAGP
jgi:hypothetical protein